MSLVEILVSIVLLGTVVVAVVTALRTTVIATGIERDHARAHQWLQSAAGVLQASPRESCGALDGVSAEAKMRVQYQQVLRDDTASPEGWDEWQIRIVEPVQVWDGARYWDPRTADSESRPSCYEPVYQLQLITIEVRSPDGRIVETRQVVKGGG